MRTGRILVTEEWTVSFIITDQKPVQPAEPSDARGHPLSRREMQIRQRFFQECKCTDTVLSCRFIASFHKNGTVKYRPFCKFVFPTPWPLSIFPQC